MSERRRVVIMGAAGRDFHDFNTVFRDDETYEVVSFTHAEGQNVGIRRNLRANFTPTAFRYVLSRNLRR